MTRRQKQLKRRAAIGTVMVIGASGAMAASSQAADFTVLNTNDTGSGSLRDAITQANLTAAPDRILFKSGLSGTITLGTTLPGVDHPLDIVGPGAANLKIDAGGTNNVGPHVYADLTISGLTLVHGYSSQGGALRNYGAHTLNVSGVDFVGNYGGNGNGGAIAQSGGTLNISDSTFTDNTAKDLGGAVYAKNAAVNIKNSVFSQNETINFNGGAVATKGTGALDATRISGSEFSHNTATTFGGALSVDGSLTSVDSSTFDGNQSVKYGGGAISAFDYAPITMNNSTVTGNTSNKFGGAIYTYSGQVSLDSTTIAGNTIKNPIALVSSRGAGIEQAFGPMKLRNSIVSGNTPLDISTIYGGSVQSSFSMPGQFATNNVTDTVAGSDLPAVDPQLGALADNGGPVKTMLPASTSPVINKGSTALTTDARGLTRPIDFTGVPLATAAGANGADPGAVEVQKPPPPSNVFTFGKVKLKKRKGTATLQVKVPGAGALVLAGSKALKGQKKFAKSAATVGLVVKAKGKAARKLKKKGKLKVKARVSFTPTGGTVKTRSRTIKLVRKKGK